MSVTVDGPGQKITFNSGPDLHYSSSGTPLFEFRDSAGHSLAQIGITTPFLITSDLAGGAGLVTGSYLMCGRNSSGSGAAGCLILTRRTGSLDALWSDGGTLRIGTNQPTENDTQSHTGGTIVGTQTSSRDAKDVLGEADAEQALNAVLTARVYRFRYKPGHGLQDEEFIGIITDESPAFGMDRDEAHPHGRSLNTVNAVGLLIGAVQTLAARVDSLETRLAHLEGR